MSIATLRLAEGTALARSAIRRPRVSSGPSLSARAPCRRAPGAVERGELFDGPWAGEPLVDRAEGDHRESCCTRCGGSGKMYVLMSDQLDGRCLCGNVTYRCDAEPAMTLVCHCEDCQRQTSSTFSILVAVPRTALHVDGDTLATHITVGTDTGEERRRQFCSKCGSAIVSLLAEHPDLAFIKAGTLNDRSWLSPTLEIWCDSAQPWLAPGANTQRLARGLTA